MKNKKSVGSGCRSKERRTRSKRREFEFEVEESKTVVLPGSGGARRDAKDAKEKGEEKSFFSSHESACPEIRYSMQGAFGT